MNKVLKDQLKAILIVPAGLAIVLVPFSMLIGWNLISLIVFWFVLTPALIIYLPKVVSGNKSHLLESLAGQIIFYCTIVFMIYDHYKTDYFQVVMMSFVVNLLLVSAVAWPGRVDADVQ